MVTTRTERTFDGVGGVRIVYDVWTPDIEPRGVLVLAHGLGEHARRYDHVAERFGQAGLITYALDHRGHGRSGAPVDLHRVGIADHARDLFAVLDAAGVERATLVGHSMGTQVCLEAWRQRPDRVAGLVLMCGSYGRITRTFHGTDLLVHSLPKVIELIDRYPALVRTLWSVGPAELFVWVARMAGEVDTLRLRSEDLVPYFEHIATLDPAMFFRMLLEAGRHSAEDALPAVRAPTLVVAAERDTFTPVRYAEQMARQIPDAELLMVPGGSHTAPIEQPTLINQRVLDFLERRVDRTSP